MSKPSEDALAMARELYARFEHADNGNDEAALAAALQRFMDLVEKAEALADKQNGALKEALERWEQARRRYDAAGAVVGRLGMTIERIQRERDEARRVARSVASDWMIYLLNGTLRDPAPDVDTALAYPEAK